MKWVNPSLQPVQQSSTSTHPLAQSTIISFGNGTTSTTNTTTVGEQRKVILPSVGMFVCFVCYCLLLLLKDFVPPPDNASSGVIVAGKEKRRPVHERVTRRVVGSAFGMEHVRLFILFDY
jgi:hypothetical protein